MNIAVIGTGYVGLVTGTCFAETGNHVICVDIDTEKVKKLKSGKITIYEPGLEVLFERNIKEKRLNFTTHLADAVKKSQIIFLALPTPPGGDGAADLSFILKVAEQLGKIINEYKIIIDKSTVPIGTSEKVKDLIAKNSLADFDVVSNPEFLREGLAVEDFMKPDRVVVGTSSERAKKILEQLYSPFIRQGNPIIFMDEKSAEMTKYAANSYLATRISFMNEIANLCERVGANVDEVRRGIGTDNRIGKRFLFPGIGYGGSCFPKDVQALAKIAEENNYDFKILKSVMKVNIFQREKFVEKIKKYFKNNTDKNTGAGLKGKKIAIWGLAFKPNTDDIREAPALYVIDELLKVGASVTVFDPEAMANVKRNYKNKIHYAGNHYDSLKNADALAIITEWNEFRNPDFGKMKKLLKNRVIFDGRNLYDLHQMKNEGFYYNSIGRKTIK